MASYVAEPATRVAATEIDHLRALPARYYVDEEILVQERERLFFKTWQYACHISELESPGAYVATEVLGQKVFVVHGEDDEFRAFYNVCPHRGHALVEGTGKKQVIVCPYHQWSFALDGQLRHNRRTRTSETPASARICLSAVRLDRLLDFLFVNLDSQADPIAEFWPGLEEHVLAACPDVRSYTLSDSASVLHPVDVQANWKIQVDNFLECYHCRIGHKSFSDMLDVANQHQALHRNYSYVRIPSAGKADNLAYPLDPDHDVMDLRFWHLFPNLGFGQFSGPGNFSLSQWVPIGPNRGYRRVVQLDAAEPTDPGMLERREWRTIWGRDVLQPEDVSFIESVQQGMSQRCFEHGWYMIDPENEEISEVMLRHFHETYLAYMGERDVA